jgi:transcriptional regulator with XRE-family HTH domain
MSDSLGARLLSMRRASGLTQAALAARIGYTASAVCHVERGSRMPGREMVEAWTSACGGHYEVTGPELVAAPEHTALLEAVMGLDPDMLSLLAEAARGLAVVQGGDRAMARQLLTWLADRAPAASARVAPKSAAGPHDEVDAGLPGHVLQEPK